MNMDATKCCEVGSDGKVFNCVNASPDLDTKWSSNINPGKCMRGECPDWSMRGAYPCLNMDGKKCCNGNTCKTIPTDKQRAQGKGGWLCRGADGSDQGPVNINWGFEAEDAAWACNQWKSGCNNACTAQ